MDTCLAIQAACLPSGQGQYKTRQFVKCARPVQCRALSNRNARGLTVLPAYDQVYGCSGRYHVHKLLPHATKYNMDEHCADCCNQRVQCQAGAPPLPAAPAPRVHPRRCLCSHSAGLLSVTMSTRNKTSNMPLSITKPTSKPTFWQSGQCLVCCSKRSKACLLDMRGGRSASRRGSNGMAEP